MIDFARALPRLRRRAAKDLRREGFPRERLLGCAVRLLDRGFFRIGSEDYAEENETYGLATMRKDHVTMRDGVVVFDYEAKGGQKRVQRIADDDVLDVVKAMKARRGGGEELLAYKEGRRWVDVKSADINEYVKEAARGDFSAKDFRTWNATVLAAVALGVSGEAAHSVEGRAQARDQARDRGGRPLPGQHARRLPGVLHRPAGVRPLRRRPHDRRGAAGAAGRGRLARRAGPNEEAVLDLIAGDG